MKNSLNKLTHHKDDRRLSDVEPSKEPMPLQGSPAFLNQVLFNLFTIFLILAALAFPYTIEGAYNHMPSLSAVLGSSKTETTVEASQTETSEVEVTETLTSESETTEVEESLVAQGDNPESDSGAVDGDTTTIGEITGDELEDDLSGSPLLLNEPSDEPAPSPDAAITETQSESSLESPATEILAPESPATETPAPKKTPSLDGPDSSVPDDGLAFPRVPVSSSKIASVGHDSEAKTLYVEFKNGHVYRYDDIPQKVYDGLMKAESHGTFFDDEIKDAGYEFKKLK